MKSERTPRQRLITQNMLSSASLFEREKSLNWSSIQDLSTFIDLFCVYDKTIVLGRTGKGILQKWKSDFFDLLSDTKFVDVEYPLEPDAFETINYKEEISLAASKHLVTFLGESESDKFNKLLKFALSPKVAYGLEEIPDTTNQLKFGREWLQTSPSHTELLEALHREQTALRSTTFLLRTFLYLAYADVRKIAFTPDSVRAPVLETILDREEQFRGKLLAKLQTSWETAPGDRDLFSRVSPFSAIVFSKAYPDKKRIVPVMAELRNMLKPIRKEFLSLEDDLLWQSRNKSMTALRKWNSILEEIERNFGIDSQLVSFKQGLNFGERVGDTIDNPTSLKSWQEALFHLPTEIVTRLMYRRPVVEIHQLKNGLPASSRLNDIIQRLFEPIW